MAKKKKKVAKKVTIMQQLNRAIKEDERNKAAIRSGDLVTRLALPITTRQVLAEDRKRKKKKVNKK